MRSLLFATLAFALTLGSASDRHDDKRQAGDNAFAVELAAARDLLSRYRPAALTLDSLFARADEAPPSMTHDVRPAARQRVLTDSLRALLVPSGRDSLVIRASQPRISGTEASISITVSGRLANGHPRGSFYETVTFTLRRDGQRWRVADRRQLGVS